MMKIVIREVLPKIETSSFSVKPKTIYRMGDKYGRVEEQPDSAMKLHGLVIVSEPKLWMINLMDKTGKLIIDPGPELVFRSPILPPVERNKPAPMPTFEFGREYDFLKSNKAVKTTVAIEGKQYDSLSLSKDGYDIVLLSRPGTETPCSVKIRKDNTVVCEFVYDEYQKDLPPKMELFEPPAGIRISEAANAQSKYPAKIGRFKFSGENSIPSGRSLKYLSEDMKIDVFFYGTGKPQAKPGAGEETKAEMEAVKRALRDVEKLGKYKDVAFEEDREVDISGIKFLRNKCSYVQVENVPKGNSGRLTSFAYLTVRDNNFLKVRATCVGEAKEGTEKELVSFITDALKIDWSNGLDLPESPENDRKILQMAKGLYDNPLGSKTVDSLATIVRYADKSKRINVTVKEGMLDTKDKFLQLYAGFYVAGSVRYYLEHSGDMADKDKADNEIKKYLVKLYQEIRKKDSSYSNQTYEEMAKAAGN